MAHIKRQGRTKIRSVADAIQEPGDAHHAHILAIVANSAFLLRSFTRTLQTQIVCLTSTIERLGQREQAARVVPLPFTDLDQVGQSINRMAEAIEQHEHTMEESMRALQRQYALVERAQSESRAIFDASPPVGR
jgi:hypothetical protein